MQPNHADVETLTKKAIALQIRLDWVLAEIAVALRCDPPGEGIREVAAPLDHARSIKPGHIARAIEGCKPLEGGT
jgi:hypothetical protein